MKSLSSLACVALILSGPALAQEPSAKATAVQSAGQHISGSQAIAPLLSTTIKAPNAKELLIDLSVQCGLYTSTLVKGKGGSTDSATAAARVMIDVEVTDSSGGAVRVTPDTAVYCERQQQLEARFGGVIENLDACTGTDPTETCILTDEEIRLALKTLTANSYNFLVVDLPGSDVYTVTATAILDTCDNGTVVADPSSDLFGMCTDGTDPDAEAVAFVNGASMFVQEVRFTN